MGLLGRVKGWFRADEPAGSRGEPTFEAYLEAAGEKLREFAVAISKLESELLSVKERMRGLERQAAACRGQAEASAARSDADGARSALEREHHCKQQLAAVQRSASSMEESIFQTKTRYALFKQSVDEASAKHDKLLMRTLAASAEWEAGKAVASKQQEERLKRLSHETLTAEALSELRQGGDGTDAIEEEIAKLLRERKS
ncbi:hypothetical protein GZH47_02970 [Paenibacillus rhizovicinus]|uniref:PspA/IM30 family protein n=1 Tax=Paenibacillus rhizovicinus TaxID=2704463 RepID=A0A6C0NUN2_9BACL|nr:hypothetical protein [Paenibacillus rhizovicinus]QHW29895.1 hypothetical protein GZH47_02970 [Paenibacillus rhizovicinus]